MNERVETSRGYVGTVVRVVDNVISERGDLWVILLDDGINLVEWAADCRVICPELDYEDQRNLG